MPYQGCVLGVHADQLRGLGHREGVWLGRAILHADARLEEVAQPGRVHMQQHRRPPTDDSFRYREDNQKGTQGPPAAFIYNRFSLSCAYIPRKTTKKTLDSNKAGVNLKVHPRFGGKKQLGIRVLLNKLLWQHKKGFGKK